MASGAASWGAAPRKGEAAGAGGGWGRGWGQGQAGAVRAAVRRPHVPADARGMRTPGCCRWALLRNMVTDLIKHERIKTTVPKAKEVSPRLPVNAAALRCTQRWCCLPPLPFPCGRCSAARARARGLIQDGLIATDGGGVPLVSSSAWRTR